MPKVDFQSIAVVAVIAFLVALAAIWAVNNVALISNLVK